MKTHRLVSLLFLSVIGSSGFAEQPGNVSIPCTVSKQGIAVPSLHATAQLSAKLAEGSSVICREIVWKNRTFISISYTAQIYITNPGAYKAIATHEAFELEGDQLTPKFQDQIYGLVPHWMEVADVEHIVTGKQIGRAHV